MSVSSTQLLKVFKELEKRIAAIDIRQGGPEGQRGATGPKGKKGERGATGANGQAGKQGPQGPSGKNGAQGATGAKGKDGRSVTGPTGPAGPKGRDGLNGAHGRDGLDGVSVTDATIDFDGHLTMQMSDGTEIDAGLITMSGDGDITYVAGGGIPDQYKRDLEQVIEDLNNHINDFNNPHQTSLENLIDTDAANPKDGQTLLYNALTGLWTAQAGVFESWPTGLANGGELNIGPGINDVEVIAGLGAIVDSYTDPLAPPAITGIKWDQINEPITVAPSVAGSVVWVSIFNTGVPAAPIPDIPVDLFVGELRQYATPPGPSLARMEIFLGVLVHNGVEWKEVSNPKVINQAAETLREVAATVLPLSSIISGGVVNELPAFELEQEAGIIWENNRNWHVDKSNPNREALPAAFPINFQYVNRDFTDVGLLTTTIDPSQWDNNGVVETVPGPANTATIQRVYLDPANNYWVLYGQYTYPNFTVAQANLNAETPVVPFILQNSILLGYVIAEKGKTDWDFDEAIFVGAGANAGGSAGGGVPITQFIDQSDTPASYGGQQHLVPVVNEVENALVFEARTRAVGDYVDGVVYNKGDEVFNGSDLSEAKLNGVQSYPFVTPTGPTLNIYEGTMPTDSKSAKQVIFGQRYTNATKGFFINGYRVYTVAGNRYEVTSIRDPLGDNVATQIASFEANSAGWFDLPISSVAIGVGSVFDLVCTVSEPDPTPIEVIASYDYQTPQNPTVPLAGQIIQGRSLPSVLSISYTDAAAGDQTALIQGLSIGDIILLGQVQYSVQTNTSQIGYADLVVAPALTTTPIGIQDVTFETVAPTPITIGEDLLYWDTSQYTETKGLLGVDVPYGDIVPDQNAYGLDISIQEAFIPDSTEWFLKVVGPLNGGGGGSGGDFTPTVFAGAGTTGYVPDPGTEQGWVLSDDGTWVTAGGVSSVVGGTAITVDATDPLNPIVNSDAFTGAGTVGHVPDPTTEQGWVLSDSGAWIEMSASGTIHEGEEPPVGAVAGDLWYACASPDAGLYYYFQDVDSLQWVPVSNTPGPAGPAGPPGPVSAGFGWEEGTPDTNDLVNTNSGNVGIGTVAPLSELEVRGAVRASNPGVQGRLQLIRTQDTVGEFLPPVEIGRIDMRGGITNTSTTYTGARISASTESQWSETSSPTYLGFWTTGEEEIVPTERMRIDSGGNVGIGTATPISSLHVQAADTLGVALTLQTTNNATDRCNIDLKTDAAPTSGNIRIGAEGTNLFFRTGSDERMRITADGYVQCGDGVEQGFSANTIASPFMLQDSIRARLSITDPTKATNEQPTALAEFYGSDRRAGFVGAVVGVIMLEADPGTDILLQTGSPAVYPIRCLGGSSGEGSNVAGRVMMAPTYANTTSSSANMNINTDGEVRRFTSSIKYKRDVQDYTSGLEALCSLRPVSFKSKSPCDGEEVYAGFIAEEVSELGLDEYVQRNEDGGPEGLAYGSMMALAVKAIQELTTRLEALENK